MSVLINFKICDNSCECGGIKICPNGALFWDTKNNKIGIDNEKCISCGICVKECPIGAIKVANNKKEYDKLKGEIDDDPRKISDLFIERYGAMPIDPDVLIEDNELENEIRIHSRPLFVELFKDDDLMCLRKSIPINELIPRENIIFRKVRIVNTKNISKKYNIKKFPCLLVFREGKIEGKIEGYFGEENEKKMKKLIKDILIKIIPKRSSKN
jgi:NAD-dependent dihydropyrimidine dehydrogenase PreA subunit